MGYPDPSGLSLIQEWLGNASQGCATTDDWIISCSDGMIYLTDRATGHSVKAAFLYDASEGSPYTDYTAAINSGTTKDVALLPATPAVGDKFYVGGFTKYQGLVLFVGQNGSGTWTITWKYWNGESWESCVGVSDTSEGDTINLKKYGYLYHTTQENWEQCEINGVTAFYLCAEVTSFTSITTQPFGDCVCLGKWTVGDAAYSDHVSSVHVVNVGGTDYLYLACSDYPDSTAGAIHRYTFPDLVFESTIKTYAADAARGTSCDVEYYVIDGVPYWWILFDRLATNQDSHIYRYASDWTGETDYSLTYQITGGTIVYQGSTWWDFCGVHYLLCNIHGGSTPSKCDVYRWNGAGFTEVTRMAQITSGTRTTNQGLCRERGKNTIWMAARTTAGEHRVFECLLAYDTTYPCWGFRNIRMIRELNLIR